MQRACSGLDFGLRDPITATIARHSQEPPTEVNWLAEERTPQNLCQGGSIHPRSWARETPAARLKSCQAVAHGASLGLGR